MAESTDHPKLLELTTEIVASYVGNNTVATSDLPSLISNVFTTLSSAGQPEVKKPEAPTPAVPVNRSIRPDYMVCLEDGKKLKMLKRYLATRYDMTPEDYRRRWGLPPDYPMVAPAYASRRSELAKSLGLGRKPAATAAPEPPPPAPRQAEAAPASRPRPARVGGRRKMA
jgi:predicted transcriptional regulator